MKKTIASTVTLVTVLFVTVLEIEALVGLVEWLRLREWLAPVREEINSYVSLRDGDLAVLLLFSGIWSALYLFGANRLWRGAVLMYTFFAKRDRRVAQIQEILSGSDMDTSALLNATFAKALAEEIMNNVPDVDLPGTAPAASGYADAKKNPETLNHPYNLDWALLHKP